MTWPLLNVKSFETESVLLHKHIKLGRTEEKTSRLRLIGGAAGPALHEENVLTIRRVNRRVIALINLSPTLAHHSSYEHDYQRGDDRAYRNNREH